MRWSPSPAAKASSGSVHLAGVDAQAAEGAAGAQHAQAALEGLLRPQRLDRHVHAAAAGQLHDRLDGVLALVVDREVGPQRRRHLQPLRHAVDGDDPAGAAQLRAHGGAQADGPLREDGHGVADADAAALGPAEAGAHDVGAHQHLLVGEPVGDGRQVGHGVRDEDVLGLAPVDGVAPSRQPPIALPPHCACWPSRHGLHCPQGVMAPTITRCPTR
jgi:hypothetical protein